MDLLRSCIIFSASLFLFGDGELEGERRLTLKSEPVSIYRLVSRSRKLFLRAIRFAGLRYESEDFDEGD